MKAARFILIFLSFIPYVVGADDFSSQNRLAQEYFEAGDDLWEEENYQGALEKYSLALTKDPTFVEAYIARGGIFDELDRYKEAVDDYSEAIRLNPKHGYAYMMRGSVRHDMHDYQGALDDFNKVIELAKTEFNPFVLNYDEEEKKSESDRLKIENLATTYWFRGWVKADLDDSDGALEDFNRSVDLNPELRKDFPLDESLPEYIWDETLKKVVYKKPGLLKRIMSYFKGLIRDE